MGIFLDKSLLMPGDVLLTRGRPLLSKAITFVTRGRYSHAAIVLNVTSIYESRSDGIGPTPLVVSRVEKCQRGFRLLAPLPDSSEGVVLRCPQLNADDTLDVSKRIGEIVKPFLGMEYPELRKLSQAINLDHRDTRWAQVVLLWIDRMSRPKINPSAFCSEFVSIILEELGCFPFPVMQRHASVSPNEFARSNLSPVPDAVVNADPTAELNHELLRELNSISNISREQFMSKMVPARQLLTLSDSFIESLTSAFPEHSSDST